MKRVNVSMSDELFAQLEAAREYEPRSSFVARVLESALSEAKGLTVREQAASDPVGSDKEPVRAAAPTRASDAFVDPETRLIANSGVGNDRDGAMAPPSSVVALSGSNPEPPPETETTPESDSRFQLPKIAPRGWVR